IPLKQFRETVKWKVQIGDLAWVKEPWCMLMPHGEVFAGHFANLDRASLPEHIRKRGYKLKFHATGKGLHRSESRHTLQIMGYTPDAGTVRCLVHRQQADLLLQRRRAA